MAAVADQCGPCLKAQELMIPRGGQTSFPIPERFLGPDQPYDCHACIQWHGEKYGFPALASANQRAWELYFRFQDQQRGGGMDVLGLDYGILDFAFRLYQIPPVEQRVLLEKIIIMNREVNRHRADKREQERKIEEAKRQSESKVKRLDVM